MESNVLIYDCETRVFGKPNPDKDELRIFGCYSYKTDKYYLLTNKEQIQKVVDAHKFLVGFNNEHYDNPIITRFGVSLKYKTIIDLRKIFIQRASSMKIKKGMLGDLLMEFSLDFVTKLLGLVTEEEGKKKIDYTVFMKDAWSPQELKWITEYTKRDIEITKKLYEFVEDYFSSFKDFLRQDANMKKIYLTAGIAKFSYKAICKAMGWEERYGEITGKEKKISGGYVAYPAGERFEGNIYCLDYNCLIKGTKITMWRNCLQHYEKSIEKLKEGEYILNQDGKQQIDMIKVQDYNGEIIEIKLNNGTKVCCTPQHIFPVYRNGQTIEIKAEDILETDDLFVPHSKRGNKNVNWKGGQIEKNCIVCGTKFYIFPSQDSIRSCSPKCTNKLKSINSSKPNLGKTKFNCKHLKRMSVERKGKKRPTQIKKNIAEGNRKATQNRYANGKFLYKGVYFKANSEVKVAQAFDRDNIKWSYEPKVFTLLNGEVYTPDFYLPELNKWVEVKGKIICSASPGYKKFKEFVKQYPNSVIINNENVNKVKEALNG